MSSNGSYPEQLPLSVLLFHAAMSHQQSISDFAETLGVGPISLRQFILGKTQRPRQKTIDLIGQTLGISSDDVRRRMDLLPETAPRFSDWLESQIEGRFSRAKLTRETKISDGALRNYLSGQTLPDSDQAQRLAEALSVDSLQVAEMIVANQMAESGGEVTLSAADMAPTEVTADLLLAEGEPTTMAAVGAAEGAASPAAATPTTTSPDEEHVLSLWRRLHPQGRRATVQFIATLLAEG